MPRLGFSKREASRVKTAAAWTRQHRADRDVVRLERFTETPRLRAAALVEIALRRAVVELRVGRIEAARRVAVTEHDDGSRSAKRFPDRLRCLDRHDHARGE